MREIIAGLQVDDQLAGFVADELLPGLDLQPEHWWEGFAELQARFEVPVQRLLERREELQAALDGWHSARGASDPSDYERFLADIGYLVPAPQARIEVSNVDPEISLVAGPQLVVPSTVPRYALNAANARWGSLFDALYGTDVLPLDHELSRGYDDQRGNQVMVEVDRLLDDLFPLASVRHGEVTNYSVVDGMLVAEAASGATTLVDPDQFVGHGDGLILLRRNGLHVELSIARGHPIGGRHHAGVADVFVEAAVTTIVDLEDSVATVDGADKSAAYRTWLGLMTGALSARFSKGGRTVVRTQHDDRRYLAVDGSELVLPGRALLLVRTVGHHMRTDAVLTAGGSQVVEGLLDAWLVATAGLYDLRRLGRFRNSRTGSIYLVKPKQHGPDEVALTVEMLTAIEEMLGLAPTTIKLGVMDEEKRTSLNLEACIAAARNRVIFINTGFLDRTGDEIHSDFHAGPVIAKSDMKAAPWMIAYEDRNVDVALAAGFRGQAQVGKGMWAKPAAMAEMVRQKITHPMAGANCAWVPSPTAATLHALHYLRVDVAERQRALAGRKTDLRRLLRVPLLAGTPAANEVQHEIRTNAQSILGYVVRWVGQGIGCSTVPDLDGVGLMEDRATLRISSQHLANWLHHGIVDEAQVRQAFAEMAVVVDRQNQDEPGYRPMSADLAGSEAFQAALELVFTGGSEPNGYTERALVKWRRLVKARAAAPVD